MDTCLELEAQSAVVGSLAPGLNDAQASRTLAELHGRWQLRLPRQSAHLWSALLDHATTAGRRCLDTAWGGA